MWVCRLPVHIGPAVCTVFTKISGEFAAAQRADVGIGPYMTPANSCCPANFECKAEKMGPPEARRKRPRRIHKTAPFRSNGAVHAYMGGGSYSAEMR